jgi:hypothetical protein
MAHAAEETLNPTGVSVSAGQYESDNFLSTGLKPILCITLRIAALIQVKATKCPSSDDLRHVAGFQKGGSGSCVIEIMRHAVDAASDGLRLSGV